MISRISKSREGGRITNNQRQSLPQDGKLSPGPQDVDKSSSLLAAVNNVSNYVQNISREVHLYVDEADGECKVTIVDSSTGRTIRHIPPHEVMSISRHIDARANDPIKGLIVKSKA
ncbi:MAG: flagellar protein FlaG [Pseudomonadales bacterium]|nr:flagellar protein FlaG [Pseudomonadales bacterium]